MKNFNDSLNQGKLSKVGVIKGKKPMLLHFCVNRDMLFNGFNPLCPIDIKRYWKERLE